MPAVCRRKWLTAVVLVWVVSAAGLGCQTFHSSLNHPGCATGLCAHGDQSCKPCIQCPVPHEMKKTTLPTYIIEPPDVLAIDAIKLIPKPPYRIEALDELIIEVAGVRPDFPIEGIFPVEPDGTVNFGPRYPAPQLIGLTLREAEKKIEADLKPTFRDPIARVRLGRARALQQIRGDHLVRPDGTVFLGTYGEVYVAGLKVPEAKAVIEAHLSQFLADPEITIDISGFNSKVFYIITRAGVSDAVQRLPITGNETVLDVLPGVGGDTSNKRIWIARPTPSDICCEQILPVNWKAITQNASTKTNYQLLPGDRLYIHTSPFAALTAYISNVSAPFERILGLGLLGVAAEQSFRFAGVAGGGFFGGFPGFGF